MQENISDAEKFRSKILDAMLSHVPFDGWSDELFKMAAKDLKTEESKIRLYFEGGIMEVIDFFSAKNDAIMMEKFDKLLKQDPKMRVRDKIKNSIIARLEIYDSMKTIVAKTTSYLSLPWNLPCSAKLAWRTADTIWRKAAGDKSTDFNYYTKRSLLVGIYTSVIMYWLADDSKNHAHTMRFLDDRIEDVMKVGKFLSKVK